MSMKGWIGVDLDGTLAEYDGWKGVDHIGRPIVPMVERVKKWLEEGKQVKIFTARVYPVGVARFGLTEFEYTERMMEALQAHKFIRDWCIEHIGKELPITCVKDFAMIELWDDRAVQVEANTGKPVGYSTRA